MRALRRRIHALWLTLLHEHTSPARLGAAVLLGCIVGCTPLFGLHFVVCVALAWLFGLNKLVVYGAANLSIPPMVPLLAFSSLQLGERILHGRWLALAQRDVTMARALPLARQLFTTWMVGGVALGAAIGLVAGGVTWLYLSRRRARRRAATAAADDAIGRAIAAARLRYDGLHPRFKWYARMKYAMDPCYRAIAARVPDRAFVVDLGSGLGMLPVLLGVLGGGRRALGVEWDAAKVACGVHAAAADPELADIHVIAGDARAFALPACDVITLVDMLHYWDADTQRALLARCRAALRDGGRLLVREGDPARAGGARFTRLVEAIVTRLGWNRGPAVRFRPIAELRADLEALGFAVSVDDVAARSHPGNVLLVCDLPAAIAASS